MLFASHFILNRLVAKLVNLFISYSTCTLQVTMGVLLHCLPCSLLSFRQTMTKIKFLEYLYLMLV